MRFQYSHGPWSIQMKSRAVHNECHSNHDDVIKWKYFPRYWPFVQGIHQSLVNPPHIGQLRGALMFSLICARINGWVNNREAGDLRRHRAHYDVTVMNEEEHDDIMTWNVKRRWYPCVSLIMDIGISKLNLGMVWGYLVTTLTGCGALMRHSVHG